VRFNVDDDGESYESPSSDEEPEEPKENKERPQRTKRVGSDRGDPSPSPTRPRKQTKEAQDDTASVTWLGDLPVDAEGTGEANLPPPPTGVPRPPGDVPVGWESSAPPAWNDVLSHLAMIGDTLKESHMAKKESIVKQENKKKAISKWLPSAVFLFKLLSSELGWATEGVPELTDAATQLVDMKIFQAIQLVRAWSKDQQWNGCILKAGLADFMKRGFVAEDIQYSPSGFSVLYFYPSGFTETDQEDFGIQQLRESFGDGEMPEEMMKAINRLQIFVPDSTYKAADQLKTTIQFLECLCGPRTIATGGYKSGLRIMEENRRLFDSEAARDKFFLLNYLYMLDRIFQSFCKEIKTYMEEQDPIIYASHVRGEGWMNRMVENAIQPWLVQGLLPSFQPPLILSGATFAEGVFDLQGGPKSKAKSASASGKSTSKAKAAAKKEGSSGGSSGGSPSWHSELPAGEYVSDWRLPSGKVMSDFFGPHNKSNTEGVPRVPHHRGGRPSAICLRYQIENGPKCRNGANCILAHIKPSDMPPEAREAMNRHMRTVYGGGGSS